MQSLDEKTAFVAMRIFLEAFSARGGDFPTLVFGDLTIESDGKPLDPAAWFDWLDALAAARVDLAQWPGLESFTRRLGSQGVEYSLGSVRDAIMVVIPMPGRYLEVEFFPDGHVEAQAFGPAGAVLEVDSDSLADAVVEDLNALSGPTRLDSLVPLRDPAAPDSRPAG